MGWGISSWVGTKGAADATAQPVLGSSAQYPRSTAGGNPGEWFRNPRGTGFAGGAAMQIPGNIGEIRGRMEKYGNLPTGYETKSFRSLGPDYAPPETPGHGPFETPALFQDYWQGVQAPMDLNVGSRVAASSGGAAGDIGPSSPWAQRSPGQAEETPWWT